MLDLQRHWYRSSLDVVTMLLLPLSWLFAGIVALRRFFYRLKIKKTIKLSVPVIVVGNITVGGTGKTPVVVWLANELRKQGFRPGIVSRGVGGQQQMNPRWVRTSSDPKIVGDEAVLLSQKSQCPMVIGIDRVKAARELLSKSNCNIVISDDGLQHYRLGRDIEIAVVDGDRQFGNKHFLPAGPLRESLARLKEVDFVLVQGKKVEALDNSFAMQLCGDEVVALTSLQQKFPLTHFQNKRVHAVAGIGNPTRFFAALRAQGLIVVEHAFPDHYLFNAKDFEFGDQDPIVMTEKDAVKCHDFADARFWCLPVELKIENNLNEKLLEKLSCVS